MRDYLKNIFEYNLKKTGGTFFSEMVFPVCWGPISDVLMGISLSDLSCSPLSIYASCLVYFLYHIKSLPSFKILIMSLFPESSTISLFSSYPLGSPVFTELLQIFLVCVHVFVFPPGTLRISWDRHKMEQLGSPPAAQDPHVLELVSGCSPTLLGLLENTVQGADQLFVIRLR